jgi:uncharacterized protein (TIGR01777 family)
VKVFVTGASGLIGRALCAELAARGHAVVGLTRRPVSGRGGATPAGMSWVVGDPAVPGAWLEELQRADAVVHLAGEPVAGGRWTAERKERIVRSRLDSTKLVAEAVAAAGPGVLVSGSAVGFYGDRGEERLTEASAPGSDFLAGVSARWEAAAAPAAKRARVTCVRTGIVLSGDGGALPALAGPFRWFVGGPLGDGAFWQPWIQLEDEVGLLVMAIEDQRVSGPLNAAAPGIVRNRDLARALGRVLRRPALFPVPRAAVRLVAGEMAQVVLASQRVVPEKALALGYRFKLGELEEALRASGLG